MSLEYYHSAVMSRHRVIWRQHSHDRWDLHKEFTMWRLGDHERKCAHCGVGNHIPILSPRGEPEAGRRKSKKTVKSHDDDDHYNN